MCVYNNYYGYNIHNYVHTYVHMYTAIYTHQIKVVVVVENIDGCIIIINILINDYKSFYWKIAGYLRIKVMGTVYIITNDIHDRLTYQTHACMQETLKQYKCLGLG